MNNLDQFSQLYGPAATHADHSIGEGITFYDQWQLSGRNSGRIIYIAQASARWPLRYIVLPDISRGGFPVEISSSEIIE